MSDIKKIIEEYKEADSEKRLSLFLDHRLLRNEFMEIEQNNTARVGRKAAYRL